MSFKIDSLFLGLKFYMGKEAVDGLAIKYGMSLQDSVIIKPIIHLLCVTLFIDNDAGAGLIFDDVV